MSMMKSSFKPPLWRPTSEGFSGHADGHVVGAAWQTFVRELTTLETERKGAAHLVSAMPGEFDLEVKSIDGEGHMGVSGVLSYRRVGASSSGLCSSFASRLSLIHPSFQRSWLQQQAPNNALQATCETHAPERRR
jgi:hypothetical protein